MEKINFTKAHFIKLGEAGCWGKECIKKNILRLDFREADHQDCLNGEWNRINSFWLQEVGNQRTATSYTNQMRKFYEADSDTLWITFHNRMLYWCFADGRTKRKLDGTKIRRVKNNWSNKDINGKKLSFDVLSTSLTKTQAFQGTICDISGKTFNYLKRKINGEVSPEVLEAIKDFKKLQQSLNELICNLTWQDFELLVDLIFTFGGWKRIEVLGRAQQSIDLDLISPIDNRRAFVQVKSQSDLKTFQEYYADFKSMPQYDEMFFIVHSPNNSLDNFRGEGAGKIIKLDKLTELAINAGLTDWIIKKSK